MNDLSCPDVEALAAELALGTVSGSERASALSHLAECSSCRRLVDELAAVADPLLLLAPEYEPSIGFESRVLNATTGAAAQERPATRLQPNRRQSRPRRFPVGRVAIAAMVVLVAAAGGLLTGQAMDDDDTAPAVRTAIAVTGQGRSTCRAFAYGEEQAWVFVSLEAPREWTADYTVEITTTGGGTPAAVGHLKLADGGGTLGTTVDVPASHLRAIRVLDASGALRYEATFT